MSAPATMRAVVFKALGPAKEVLQIVQDWPRPVRAKGEVLVQVIATSVNPVDAKIRGGKLPKFIIKVPKIPNGDLAGIVVEADADSKFKPNDRVLGCSDGWAPGRQDGASAEFHSVCEAVLAHMPPGLSFTDAAALPMVTGTAYQALAIPGFPLTGKSVLIHAGAGGVGHVGIQIAKALGASSVATTCSTRNVDLVKELGADIVFDYTKEPFDVTAKNQGLTFDLVVDMMGGDYEDRSIKLVKKGGHFSEIFNQGWETRYKSSARNMLAFLSNVVGNNVRSRLGLGPKYHMIFFDKTASKYLHQVLEMVKAGKLKPLVDRVLPLEASAEAHELIETGHVRGKIVLQVANDPTGSTKAQ